MGKENKKSFIRSTFLKDLSIVMLEALGLISVEGDSLGILYTYSLSLLSPSDFDRSLSQQFGSIPLKMGSVYTSLF